MLGHEVDLLGCRELGGDDDIALVLAVLGVNQDVGATVAGVLDDVLDGADGADIGIVAGTGGGRDQVGTLH